MTTPRHQKAIDRHDAIWQRYYANGDKITQAECIEILGTQHIQQIWKSLATYDLYPPPVWDSRAGKYTRYAEMLNAEAKRLRTDSLTYSQVSKLLGVTTAYVPRIYESLERGGASVPPLRRTDRGTNQPVPENLPRLTETPAEYPDGVQYSETRPGDKPGQVIYLLK